MKELGDFQNYFNVLREEAADLASLLEELADQQQRLKGSNIQQGL